MRGTETGNGECLREKGCWRDGGDVEMKMVLRKCRDLKMYTVKSDFAMIVLSEWWERERERPISVVHVMTAGVPCRARHLSKGDVIKVYARRRNVESGRISLGLVPVVWQMGWLDYVGFCGWDLFLLMLALKLGIRFGASSPMFTKMQHWVGWFGTGCI